MKYARSNQKANRAKKTHISYHTLITPMPTGKANAGNKMLSSMPKNGLTYAETLRQNAGKQGD